MDEVKDPYILQDAVICNRLPHIKDAKSGKAYATMDSPLPQRVLDAKSGKAYAFV